MPGGHHLAVRRPRQLEVGVRVEPPGDDVHLVAPRPERAAPALGAPAQGAVEGVAVAVGQARDGEAEEHVVGLERPGLASGDDDRSRRVTAVMTPSSTSTTTPGSHAPADPGVLEQVGRSSSRQLREGVGQRLDPGQAVGGLGGLGG